MFKKFVSLAVGTACLFSMVGVSALEVTTSTAYQASGIKVTTTVSGTESEMIGTTLTYLAHDVEGITDGSSIVYVDQIVAAAASEKFEYVTQYSKIGSTVKVGGRTSAGTAITPALGSQITGVPVKVDGADASDVEFTVFSDDDLTATNLVQITATELNGLAGIADLTYNGGTPVPEDTYFAGNDCIWVNYGVLDSVVAGGALEITLDTTAGAKVQTASLGYKLNDDTEDGPSAIAIGYVSGNVDEYGIVFSSDETISKEALTAYEDVAEAGGDVAFPALGKGSDGLYAVEVYNVDDFAGTLDGYVYAAAYVKKGDAYTIGKVFKVSTSGVGGASLASIELEEVVEDEAIIFDVVEEDDEIEFIEIEDVIEIEEIEEIEEVDEVDEIDIVE